MFHHYHHNYHDMDLAALHVMQAFGKTVHYTRGIRRRADGQTSSLSHGSVLLALRKRINNETLVLQTQATLLSLASADLQIKEHHHGSVHIQEIQDR